MKIAQAQINFPALEGVAAKNIAGKGLGDLVSVLVPYFFALAGSLLLVYLIWGGISLMLSQGDPKKIESGKNKITSALVGFLVVFVSYWIVQLFGLVLGIRKITDIFK